MDREDDEGCDCTLGMDRRLELLPKLGIEALLGAV
jgi:hypothetical protein